jgi:hypothetical protein
VLFAAGAVLAPGSIETEMVVLAVFAPASVDKPPVASAPTPGAPAAADAVCGNEMLAEEHHVTRSALIAVLALALLPAPLSGPKSIGCAEAYQNYLERLKDRRISPGRRTALQRWALRAYDACETGDVQDVEGLFQRLDRDKY